MSTPLVNVKSTVPIPVSSEVRVSGLSPAGEQYIDFAADSDAGPYLSDGAVIAQGKATVPVSLAELLADADGALAQVDTSKLELIKKELSLSDQGPQKLADIIDGGTFLLSTLDSVLPETTSVLRTSRVVLTMAADKSDGISVASDNLSSTFDGITKMRDGYRRLTDEAPGTLTAIDNLFTDNSDTMVQLLGSLTTTSQLLYLRVPALNALFPNYRTSALDAIGSVMHDNGLWATGDIYPRYACEYGTSAPATVSRRTTPSRSCTPTAATTTPVCWSAGPRTRRGRPATTPRVRPRARTSVEPRIRPRRAGSRFPRRTAARSCRSSHHADQPTRTFRGDDHDSDDRQEGTIRPTRRRNPRTKAPRLQWNPMPRRHR